MRTGKTITAGLVSLGLLVGCSYEDPQLEEDGSAQIEEVVAAAPEVIIHRYEGVVVGESIDGERPHHGFSISCTDKKLRSFASHYYHAVRIDSMFEVGAKVAVTLRTAYGPASEANSISPYQVEVLEHAPSKE